MDITQEQFLEKYADVRVHFSSYYKYSFTYTGIAEDGTVVSVDYGGYHEDIYRMEIKATDSFLLGETARTFRYGTAEKDGETIDNFYKD
jgi:hypothetical protein